MKYKFIQEFSRKVKKKFKKKFLELNIPLFSKTEKIYLSKAINENKVSTYADYTKKFEEKLKKFHNIKYAIATINGTSALHASLLALGIKKNDEVLVPNLNFIASANAVLYSQAIPHFIDTKKGSIFLDSEKLKVYLNKVAIIKKNICINKITKRKIHSLMVTHIFGHVDNMYEIKKIVKKYKLKLIEDASEALGSLYDYKHAGTFGDIGILSFNGNKIITTGGGGAVITNSKKYAKKILRLVSINRKKKSIEYDYYALGYNYRMPSINAILGIAQLKKMKKFLKCKRKIYLNYKNIAKNFNQFDIINEPKNCKSNYWLQGIILKKSSILKRNSILNQLSNEGIQARPVWKLMHKIKHLKKFPRMNSKNSLEIEKKIINLPSSVNLTYEN